MGKKKISQFPPATPVSGDKFLIEKADGTYKNVEFDDLASATPSLQDVTDVGSTTTNAIDANGFNSKDVSNVINSYIDSTGIYVFNSSFSGSNLLEVDRVNDIIRYLGVQVATVNDVVNVDVNTIGTAVNGAASATPNDTDLVMSVDTSVAKKNTWTQIKSFLKTYFDTLYTLKSNNLSDLTNTQTAKANLNIDKRTTVGDANYTILTTDKEIVTSVTLTASRTYTLPTGETAGQEFIVADEFQTLGTYTITVGVATGKKLNGVTNGTVTMVTAGGHRRFFGDGNGNYTYDSGLARLGVSQTFSGTNTFSVSPIFTDYTGTRNSQKMWDLFLTNGDQTTTSSTASNITDLVSTTLTANKRYKIHGIIHVGCNNTGGVKIQITIPTGATVFLMTNGFTSGSTVNAWSGINSSATLGAAFCTANSTGGCIMVNGEISLSSTAGTIQFGFASGVNTQTSTIYQLGTQIILTQIN